MNTEQYKKALDGITATQEEKLMAIKNITEQQHRTHRPKTAAIAAFCAAALLCGTLTVGAVTNWDYQSLFTSFFEKQTDKTPDYDFTGMGKDINQSIKFDNYTLNIKSLIADENNAYLLYDIVFDDGYDYAPEGYGCWSIIADGSLVADGTENTADTKQISCIDNGELRSFLVDTSHGGECGAVGYASTNTKCMSFFSRMYYSGTDTSIAGRSIVFEFDNLVCCDNYSSVKEDIVNSISLPCDYTLKVDIDFDVNAHSITAAPDCYADLGNFGKGNITSLKITPLSIMVDVADYDGFNSPFDAKGELADFDTLLYMGDTTAEIELSSTYVAASDSTMQFSLYLSSPIDTSKVTAIKIGDATIPLR